MTYISQSRLEALNLNHVTHKVIDTLVADTFSKFIKNNEVANKKQCNLITQRIHSYIENYINNKT